MPTLAGDQPHGGAISLSLPLVGINWGGGGAALGLHELTEDWEPEGAGRLGKEIMPPKIDS